jgi:DNA polymerase-3 subunit delta
MKIAYPQLAQQLKKKLAPVYLICTDEILLAQDAAQAIRAAARAAGFNERVTVNLEQGSDWEKLLFANTHSLSLFSTQRIVELHLAATKPNAAATKILQEIAAAPLPDTLLLITTSKLDSKLEKSAWFKALDKMGIVIQIWPVTPEQLPAWISQRAQQSGLTLSANAAKFLASQVEGNLLAAAQEIEKLGLLQTADTAVIDTAIIEKMITDNARFDIFSLVECALSGNTQRSLRILENLEADDTEPLLVLWALSREVRTMTEIARQSRQGTSLGSLFSQFRIWEKRQPGARRFLQQHDQRSCWQLLIESAKIDRIIKGAQTGKVWDELKRLTLKIAKNGIITGLS